MTKLDSSEQPGQDKQDGPDDIVDLLVVGGGINGAGVARDAAGRGLSVILCEKDDLASHTSSSSTKLIHGGLRYLELYDFKLVRHALKEREILLKNASHIIWPMRFILPHHRALRPRWLIRLGLFLYDHLSRLNLLPGSHSVNLKQHPAGKLLQEKYSHGFEYSDCWVQDARLVVLNALDARQRGAEILTRTNCVSLDRDAECWLATLVGHDGQTRRVRARGLVNASGPWVDRVADMIHNADSSHGVRLVKGSHIIVRSMFDHDYPYIFQNSDGRVMFAIPFESKFTLIGTTDIEIEDDPGNVAISDEEITYLCENANQYFKQQISATDVVHSYSGVRPLFDDAAENASKTTRDYVLHLDSDGPPVVSIYGGKITTYRRLAEDVLEILTDPLSIDASAWTAGSVLPGGDIDGADYDNFVQHCNTRYAWADKSLVARLARNYGTRIDDILHQARDMEDLGRHFGCGLYQCEVDYLVNTEMARTTEDILVRRTRLGMHGGDSLGRELDQWFDRVNGITPDETVPGQRGDSNS